MPYEFGRVDVVLVDIMESYSPDFWPRNRELEFLRGLLEDETFLLQKSMDGLLLFAKKKPEMPAGLQNDFMDRINNKTHGEADLKVLKARR